MKIKKNIQRSLAMSTFIQAEYHSKPTFTQYYEICSFGTLASNFIDVSI